MSFFGGSGFGASTPAPFGQPASQPSLFGQAATPAFGAASTPAFGQTATPAFGQTAFGAAQAPASQPAFGGFGSTTPAFGAPATPAPASNPFGAASAATTAFGATSAFGAPATSAFGAPSPATSAFGAPATSAFGAASPATSAFGASPGAGAPRGTRAVPWRKTQDLEAAVTAGGKPYFNSISCMPEYANKSVEELRWEDYQDGCKGVGQGQAAPGLFGQPAAGQQTQTGAFGGFGQPQQQQLQTTTSLFGQPTAAQTPSAFGGFGGAASTPSLFGGAQSAPAFGAAGGGAFGSTSAGVFGAASTPSTGLFGAATQAAANPFGASSVPAFGGFGAAQPAAQTQTNPFGQTQTQSAFGGTSAFGTTPAANPFGQTSTPGSTFGGGAFGTATATPAATNPFGQPQAGAASTPAFGGFGQTPAAPAAANPFGAPAAGAGAAANPFGASTGATTSLFGQPQQQQQQQQQQQPSALGGTSLFGQPQSAAAPSAGAFGFGASSAASSSSLFGATTSGTSLFGATPASAPAATPSLFGAASSAPAAGTSLFGTATPAAGGSSSLFGTPKPAGATSSLFGASAAPQGTTATPSLFGAASSAPAAGTSLFGAGAAATGAAGGSSLFGAAPAAGAAGAGASLWGQSGAAQAQAPLQQQPGQGQLQPAGQGAAQGQAQSAQGGVAGGAAGAPSGPYGSLPPPPSLPPSLEHRVGLTARVGAQQRTEPPAASVALAPRPLPSLDGLSRARRAAAVAAAAVAASATAASTAASAASALAASRAGGAASGFFAAAAAAGAAQGAGASSAAPAPAAFVARSDPRALLVRAPLPSLAEVDAKRAERGVTTAGAAGASAGFAPQPNGVAPRPSAAAPAAGEAAGGAAGAPPAGAGGVSGAASDVSAPPPGACPLPRAGSGVAVPASSHGLLSQPSAAGGLGTRPASAAERPSPLGPGHPDLPTLTRPGYYVIPSLEEMSRRLREWEAEGGRAGLAGADEGEDGEDEVGTDGGSAAQASARRRRAHDLGPLSCVRNLTIGREGVGSVWWVDPAGVDVRGLDLDRIVVIEQGAVEVYPEDELEGADDERRGEKDVTTDEDRGEKDAAADEATENGDANAPGVDGRRRRAAGLPPPLVKPPVGEGLNGPAEVTLQGVFRRDRATGRPSADPVAIARFEAKLRRVAADQGARFVSYDSIDGTWRFRVEHFSRYGMADDSDEDDDDGGEGGRERGGERGQGGAPGLDGEGRSTPPPPPAATRSAHAPPDVLTSNPLFAPAVTAQHASFARGIRARSARLAAARRGRPGWTLPGAPAAWAAAAAAGAAEEGAAVQQFPPSGFRRAPGGRRDDENAKPADKAPSKKRVAGEGDAEARNAEVRDAEAASSGDDDDVPMGVGGCGRRAGAEAAPQPAEPAGPAGTRRAPPPLPPTSLLRRGARSAAAAKAKAEAEAAEAAVARAIFGETPASERTAVRTGAADRRAWPGVFGPLDGAEAGPGAGQVRRDARAGAAAAPYAFSPALLSAHPKCSWVSLGGRAGGGRSGAGAGAGAGAAQSCASGAGAGAAPSRGLGRGGAHPFVFVPTMRRGLTLRTHKASEAPSAAVPTPHDLGRALGRSTRAGWAPGGVVARAGGLAGVRAPVGLVRLLRVAPAAVVGGDASERRRRALALVRALEVRRLYAAAGGEGKAGAGSGAPSGASSPVPSFPLALSSPLLSGYASRMARLERGEAAEVLRQSRRAPDALPAPRTLPLGSDAQHANPESEAALTRAADWDLLARLFAAPDERLDATERPLADASGAEGGAAAGPGSEKLRSLLALDRSLLASFRRRASVSAWLEARARPGALRDLGLIAKAGPVDEAVPVLCAGPAPLPPELARSLAAPLERRRAGVLVLLTAHSLGAASALAAAAGDVRLATLIPSAGALTEPIRRQVRAWAEEAAGEAGEEDSEEAADAPPGSLPRVSPALMPSPSLRAIYSLLAGDPGPATALLGLEWRRALGLEIWYAHPPETPLWAALDAYDARVRRGTAPKPFPPWALRRGDDEDARAAERVGAVRGNPDPSCGAPQRTVAPGEGFAACRVDDEEPVPLTGRVDGAPEPRRPSADVAYELLRLYAHIERRREQAEDASVRPAAPTAADGAPERPAAPIAASDAPFAALTAVEAASFAASVASPPGWTWDALRASHGFLLLDALLARGALPAAPAAAAHARAARALSDELAAVGTGASRAADAARARQTLVALVTAGSPAARERAVRDFLGREAGRAPGGSLDDADEAEEEDADAEGAVSDCADPTSAPFAALDEGAPLEYAERALGVPRAWGALARARARLALHAAAPDERVAPPSHPASAPAPEGLPPLLAPLAATKADLDLAGETAHARRILARSLAPALAIAGAGEALRAALARDASLCAHEGGRSGGAGACGAASADEALLAPLVAQERLRVNGASAVSLARAALEAAAQAASEPLRACGPPVPPPPPRALPAGPGTGRVLPAALALAARDAARAALAADDGDAPPAASDALEAAGVPGLSELPLAAAIHVAALDVATALG